MTTQFDTLDHVEKELAYDAIPLITLLIAYADGEMDDNERSWAEKIADIRSYSGHESLFSYYEKIGENYQEKLDQLLKTLPEDNEQRLAEISNRLSKLNAVFPQLEPVFAWRFYNSLVSFAEHVAKASGGFLGWASISKDEKDMIGLKMLEPVVLEEEPED